MSKLGNSAEIQILINGKELLAPSELFDIAVNAEFGQDGVQANLSIEELTFRGNARTEVNNHIAEGLNGGVGIFEGIPIQIRAFSKTLELDVFEGYIDLTDGYIDDDANNQLKVTIKKADGLNSLDDRLNGVTFGNLVDKGIITSSDYTEVEYVVEKPFNLIETFTVLFVIYTMTEKVIDTVKDFGKDRATAVGIATSSPTGAIGAANQTTLSLIVQLAYSALLVVSIVRLARQLINTFLPPKRTHKTLNLYTALQKIAIELGYTFESTEQDFLEKIYYLPSNLNFDESTIEGFVGVARGTSAGIPSPSDFGYNCSEMVELAKQLINGNKAVLDEKLYLNWKGSDFFERQASVTLFDALIKNKAYNTDEAVRSRLIGFSTDVSDIWTIENFTGTNYQVLTEPETVQNQKFVTLKGAEQIAINVALGNRKDSLNPLERTIESVLNIFDSIVNVLGGTFGINVDFSNIISSKIGLLKVGDNNHSIPKLLYLEGGKIPVNHREQFSAKVIENTYYVWDSFVRNADKAQKEVYDDVSVPFGISDFIKVLDNAYLYNSTGESSKITSLSWLIGKDRATVSYFIRKKYTDNLKESFIET